MEALIGVRLRKLFALAGERFRVFLYNKAQGPERASPQKRRYVRVRNSSSGSCVPNLAIEPNLELLTKHFYRAAKVIHRWLRGVKRGHSSPPVNNFGRTISAGAEGSGAPAFARRSEVVMWPNEPSR